MTHEEAEEAQARTIEGMWHGEMVRLTLTPEAVREALDDIQTAAHLHRLSDALTRALAELDYYGRADDDWAGLHMHIPAGQFKTAARAIKVLRTAVNRREQELGAAIDMRRHLLGKR